MTPQRGKSRGAKTRREPRTEKTFSLHWGSGRVQRSPLIVEEQDIETLAKALAKASKRRTMLAALGSLRGGASG